MSGDRALPGVLADIERLAGRKRAEALARMYGGRRIYVPRASRLRSDEYADHPLRLALGKTAAIAVAAVMAGTTIEIPKARRALAISLRASGWSAPDIACELGVTGRAVRRYLASR